MSSALARGAVREGELLLAGLLRCGHSGRKLHVHYETKLCFIGHGLMENATAFWSMPA